MSSVVVVVVSLLSLRLTSCSSFQNYAVFEDAINIPTRFRNAALKATTIFVFLACKCLHLSVWYWSLGSNGVRFQVLDTRHGLSSQIVSTSTPWSSSGTRINHSGKQFARKWTIIMCLLVVVMGGSGTTAYLVQQQDWIIAPALLLMALSHERTLGFTKRQFCHSGLFKILWKSKWTIFLQRQFRNKSTFYWCKWLTRPLQSLMAL